MAKHYVVCENMCLEEAYSKKDIDEQRVAFKVDVSEFSGQSGGGALVSQKNFGDYDYILENCYVESVMIADKRRGGLSKRELAQGATLVLSVSSTPTEETVKVEEVKVIIQKTSKGFYNAVYNIKLDRDISSKTVDFYLYIVLHKMGTTHGAMW